MAKSSFGPLSPEMLAEDRARRAAAEAEITRKEALLAEAQARLDASRIDIREMEAELQDLQRPGDLPAV